jgi:hypothetical protein
MGLRAILYVDVKRKSHLLQELSLSLMEKVIKCSDGG